MRKIFLAFIFISSFVFAQEKKPTYFITIDLIEVENDQIQVEMIVPKVESETVNFYMPLTAPGTYEVLDFGRLVSDLKAFDKSGNSLKVRKQNKNMWKIHSEKSLHRISYKIDDTFDHKIQGKQIFDAAGVNIDKEKNFVLNNFAVLGYLEGTEKNQFQLEIIKPSNFYGATALKKIESSTKSDVYLAKNYVELADSPIMYSLPDTASFYLANCKVNIALYSSKKVDYSAKDILDGMKKTLKAQKIFIGKEKMPVDEYSFIIYLSDSKTISEGALEHFYSSFYYLPILPKKDMIQLILKNSVHEFFHIITPLSIHAEQIQNFDFNHPKMSEHLWLYEGVVEYFANQVLFASGQHDVHEYLDKLRNQIYSDATVYNQSISFTKLSKNILDYPKEYGNVYQKGALIGLCLDLMLIKYSDGKYNLMNLMDELSKKYDNSHPFKDDELFQTIGEMTYPQIQTFLEKHVGDTIPLPYEKVFSYVGVDYFPEIELESVSIGNIGMQVNADQRLMINDTSHIDPFGRKMQYQIKDVLLKFNGEELFASTANHIYSNFTNKAKVGDSLSIVVLREVNGQKQKVELKQALFKVKTKHYHMLNVNDAFNDKNSAEYKNFQAWKRQALFDKANYFQN